MSYYFNELIDIVSPPQQSVIVDYVSNSYS